MIKNHSIAKRLALWLVSGTAIFWLAAASISGLVLRSELNSSYDSLLEQSANRLLPLAILELSEGEREEEADMRQIFEKQTANAQITYFIRSATGRFILSPDALPDKLDTYQMTEGFSDFGNQRMFFLTDAESGYGIVVLEKSDIRLELLQESIIGLLWPLLALLPLIAIGVWWALKFALKPIDRLHQDIASRDEKNLGPVDGSHHPKELEPIAHAVAELLGRLETALESERAFAGHYAHELRTPIAGALAQVQRLKLEHDHLPRLENIENALQRLSDLSEKLLQLNRVETGFAKSDQEHDLSQILQFVVQDFENITEYYGRIDLNVEPDVTLVQKIDPDAFAIIVRNLIKNALVHGDLSEPVLVKTDASSLRISNKGSVVSSNILKTLGVRFARGDTDADGNGLGLAIVKTICDQVGAQITFSSPRLDQQDGFEVHIHF